MKRVDLTTLPSINEWPAVSAANKALTDAHRQLDEIQRQWTDADTELHAAEHEAAVGTRSDKRLHKAREQLTHWESEHRIAQQRVTAAEQTAIRVRHDALLEVERELRDAYEIEKRALTEALEGACPHSWAMSELEAASTRIFDGGMYRREPGRALLTRSWSREFGEREGQPDTRFKTWKAFDE